jgi:hypothetical protein
MGIPKFLRGQDLEIVARQNSIPILAISINSGTLTWGLQVEEVNEAGKDTPTVDGFNGVVSLALDTNLNNPNLLLLMVLQRRKNAGEIELDVDAEITFDFGRIGGQGIVRMALPDCEISEATTPITGGTERVTHPLTLTSSRLLPRQ